MFRLGAKLSGAGICCLALLTFLMLFNSGSVLAVTDDDWNAVIVPERIELIIGGDFAEVYVVFDFESTIGADDYDMYFTRVEGINIFNRVSIIPSWNHTKIWTGSVGENGAIIMLPFEVSLLPDFIGTDEIRVDLRFALMYKDNTTGLLWTEVSLYIIPVVEGTWDVVSWSPQFTTMTDNETEILYITIQNSSSQSRTFNISPTTLHHGFGVSPSSDTITIDPDSTYQWATTLTCTGFGLETGTQYLAVSWDVTDTNTGIVKGGGWTAVTYIGPEPTPIEHIEIVWYIEELEIPFGESENGYLIIKNVGDVPLTLIGDPPVTLTFRAKDPIWPYDVIDPGWSAIAAGENENVRIVFWARGDPEEMDDWARIVAAIEDNYGNKREAILEIRAVVGTFSLSVIPEILMLQRGQTGSIRIRITNNENVNRNYIITAAEELRTGIYWARSDPPIENVELTPYTSRDTTIEITAMAPRDGIWPYEYQVHCEQTGFVGRVEVSIEIVTLPTGTYPQQFSSLLQMFVPLTGTVEAAGWIMAVIVVLMFVMIGLAMTGNSGNPIGTVIMTVFAITLVSVLGWFPSWIMGLTILVLALGMARWMHEYL